MPMHKGHMHLIERAGREVNELIVLVCSLASEPIPGELRYKWVKETFPNIIVHHMQDENPQEPHEHPEFWDIWLKSIRKFCPDGPDVLFSSEEYGYKLSEVLGCIHRPVDIQRTTFPISGTKIRQNPHLYWDFIPESVKPYFLKKIVIYGSESTGKTTTASFLAKEFDTIWVPEFARDYLEKKNNIIEDSDFPVIARGQIQLEEDYSKKARGFLFCDTDLHTTKIYSNMYIGYCEKEIENLAESRKYDLYLLMDIDIDWVSDPLRDFPNERKEMHRLFLQELKARSIPYILIKGQGKERLQNAKQAVKIFFHID